MDRLKVTFYSPTAKIPLIKWVRDNMLSELYDGDLRGKPQIDLLQAKQIVENEALFTIPVNMKLKLLEAVNSYNHSVHDNAFGRAVLAVTFTSICRPHRPCPLHL